MFRQVHEPGKMGLSDFTDMGKLAVSIAGEPLVHRLYHFRLAYSGFQHAHVVLGGESFVALAEGLQNALWSLGGVPVEHRTDSLSAAFKNLEPAAEKDLTDSMVGLCSHYGMMQSRNNKGVAHENGSIESPNGHLKRAINDALIMRGSRDFADLLRAIDASLMSSWAGSMHAMPSGSTSNAHASGLCRQGAQQTANSHGPRHLIGRVPPRKVFYTVPSRLIGHHLRDGSMMTGSTSFSGPACSHCRARGNTPIGWGLQHVVSYHHVIHSLRQKPMALMGSDLP